jgi:galactosyl transferase GMA12/MNN10 family
VTSSDIILVSGHWPLNIFFATNTRKTIEHYCSIHGYQLYYDEIPPTEIGIHHLHYRRCVILGRAALKYPNAKWFVWLDSDVWVNRVDLKIESAIDLSDTNILYHLFHEKPWEYPVNTGVKFVSREAIKIESHIWELRNEKRWRKFPFEQKIMCEKIIPQYSNRIIIHSPYILNCIDRLYPVQNAVFVHLCHRSENFRNGFMNELLSRKRLSQTPLINDHNEYAEIIEKMKIASRLKGWFGRSLGSA